jgi:hypothetical protein
MNKILHSKRVKGTERESLGLDESLLTHSSDSEDETTIKTSETRTTLKTSVDFEATKTTLKTSNEVSVHTKLKNEQNLSWLDNDFISTFNDSLSSRLVFNVDQTTLETSEVTNSTLKTSEKDLSIPLIQCPQTKTTLKTSEKDLSIPLIQCPQTKTTLKTSEVGVREPRSKLRTSFFESKMKKLLNECISTPSTVAGAKTTLETSEVDFSVPLIRCLKAKNTLETSVDLIKPHNHQRVPILKPFKNRK